MDLDDDSVLDVDIRIPALGETKNVKTILGTPVKNPRPPSKWTGLGGWRA